MGVIYSAGLDAAERCCYEAEIVEKAETENLIQINDEVPLSVQELLDERYDTKVVSIHD